MSVNIWDRRMPNMDEEGNEWMDKQTNKLFIIRYVLSSMTACKWIDISRVFLLTDIGRLVADWFHRLNNLSIARWIDQLIDWSIDWLIDCLYDCFVRQSIGWPIDYPTDWKMDWWIHRLIDWLIDWFIYWVINWLVDWLVGWFTHMHTTGININWKRWGKNIKEGDMKKGTVELRDYW